MNKTLGWMVDENNTLIGPNGNISVSWRGEVMPCPADAICSVGMDNGLVFIIWFAFLLGMLGGWAMKYIVDKEQRKKDMKIIDNQRWDKPPIEGVHEYSPNCEVYGCDNNHV